MMLICQKGDWDCGPTSLVNALTLLGRRASWDEVVAWTKGNNVDGTSAAGLVRTLQWLKVPYKAYLSADIRRSWVKLAQTHGPAILCVDGDSHWVVLVSGIGRRVVVWDPLVGIRIYGRKQMLHRWVTNKKCYGIFL